MNMTDMSTLLDSLDFDDEGKSIEKLMLKHLNGGFGSFVMNQEDHKNAYTIGTAVVKRNAVDGEGNTIIGVIENYYVVSSSYFYMIKYSNGQGHGWELILEDDITKVLEFVM